MRGAARKGEGEEGRVTGRVGERRTELCREKKVRRAGESQKCQGGEVREK